MKKNIFLLLSVCLLSVGQIMAGNVLTVSNVSVPQGGQATIEIGCEFDTEYTAFELQLDLPDGLTLLSDEDGKPIVERAFDGSHTVTGSLLSDSNITLLFCGIASEMNSLSNLCESLCSIFAPFAPVRPSSTISWQPLQMPSESVSSRA